MSTQVLSNSATNLAVSPSGEKNFDFDASAIRAGERQAKGITRERATLDRNKLVSACCADYRAHFAGVFGKTDRLPSEIFEKIDKAVDKYITKFLSMVHLNNSISFRRAFFHNAKQMEVTERVQATGENKLALKEQHLGITLFITNCEKRLKDLQAKPTPDYDREKEVKQTLMKLNITKSFIEGEMAHQEKLVAK